MPHTLEMPRPMQEQDVPAVLQVQAACHAAHHWEPAQAFASKLTASPGGCWVIEGRTSLERSPTGLANDTLALSAYLVTLPVDEHSFPALHAAQWQRPAHPSWLYLHDMAVSPEARSRGLGQRLLHQARQHAKQLGLLPMALVAVQGTMPYWQGHGFTARAPHNPVLADKLASFGAGATFMVCDAQR